jgi:plasmid segregation protein ParM
MAGDQMQFTVAVDDGYAATKCYAAAGPAGRPVRLVVPTAVRAGHHGMSGIDGSAGPELGLYETGGHRYTAGDRVVGEETRFDDFHTSEINRVAVHHALHMAGFTGRRVNLITGLPVGDFYLGGKRNVGLIQRKIDNLGVPVDVSGAAPDAAITIGRARVFAQAVSAYLDYALIDDGAGNLMPRQGLDDEVPVCVVDIGGRTTDYAVIMAGERGQHVLQDRSGHENVGVLDVQELVAREIGLRHGFKERLSGRLYDRAIRTGRVKVFQDVEDVSDIVAAAVGEVGSRIERIVNRYVGSGADLSAVLFVGGGAELFRSVAGRFRNGMVAEDPEFCNVRGMMKYALISDGSR